MSNNLSAEALTTLRQAWDDLMNELDSYPDDLHMFWHENDLRMQLCHKLINRSNNRFDVHANVKLEAKAKVWGDKLQSKIVKAVNEIGEFRSGNNYVDVVINRKQDVSSSFLVCLELKYWYYVRPRDRLLEGLKKDLRRLRVLKECKVTEETACYLLYYEQEDSLIHKVEEILERYRKMFSVDTRIHREE